MRTSSTLSMNRSAIASPTVGTLTVLQLPPGSALPFDAAAGVVVAHALRVADLLYVVDGDLESVGQPTRACVATRAPPRPFAIAGHQDHRDVGDGGLRLDERLDAVVFGHP